MKRRLAGGLLLAAAGLAAGCGAVTAAQEGEDLPPAEERPNIVLIVTDDQTQAAFSAKTMPRTARFFSEAGTRFTDAIVTTPVCCPSRATMITGQYAHNHRVLSNKLGYPALAQKRNVLPVWLQRAGYNTLHVGKYLHKWRSVVGNHVAPGWTEWHTQRGARYYDYRLAHAGWLKGPERYGHAADDHLSLVLNKIARRVVRRYAALDAPLYLQFDAFAPHYDNGRSRSQRCRGERAVPAPTDLGRFADAELPRSAAFNERDLSDKPRFLQRLPPITAAGERRIRRSWRCALAATLAVDRGFAAIAKELAAQGELERTAFIFISDNGYAYGEHRARQGKQLPYEELIRVPLLASLPAGLGEEPRPRRLDLPVANLDIAPTILDLAGARPCRGDRCRRLDGRSLVAPLAGERSDRGFVDRALAIEYGSATDRNYSAVSPCSYRGVRVGGRVLVEHTRVPVREAAGGRCRRQREHEYYDLTRDPDQLHNSYRGKAGQARLLRRMRRLSRCSGIPGRDKQAPGVPYCE
ncbi:MAG: hypothetical protein E4H22_05505, partial [Solirubrobacterales bacterium]